jgi:hypothetical protein
MNMVFHTADDDRLAILVRQDAAEVTVQFIAQWFVTEQWAAVFGLEDGVNQNLGERLGHETMMFKFKV